MTEQTQPAGLPAIAHGKLILPHDGATEWADCAECGRHLTGQEPACPSRWQGECYFCGAPPEHVGLALDLSLVKAADDLLAACEECLPVLEKCHDIPGDVWEGADYDVEEKVEAAIAKAKGE